MLKTLFDEVQDVKRFSRQNKNIARVYAFRFTTQSLVLALKISFTDLHITKSYLSALNKTVMKARRLPPDQTKDLTVITNS